MLVREQGGHYLLSEGRSSLTVSSSSGAMYVAHVTSAIRGYLMENAIMQKAQGSSPTSKNRTEPQVFTMLYRLLDI